MASLIVLDASVLIAAFEADDEHHQAAGELLDRLADQPFRISPINRAEILVAPAKADKLDEFDARLRRIGIKDVPLPDDAAVRLARLRAGTGLKMPDCCLILAAQQTDAAIATFDDKLASAATKLGIALESQQDDKDPG